MERKFLNARHVMNMVIMFLSFQKEKINSKEDLDLEDLEISCMLMRKKRKNMIKEKVKMNWNS